MGAIKAKTTPTKTTSESKQPKLIAENSKITLTIAHKEGAALYAKKLASLATKTKAAGFRKGKVPTAIAEGIIGKTRIIEEVLQTILPNLYKEEIAKLGKKPLTAPEYSLVSLDLDKDWVVEAHFAEKPVTKLGDYKKIVKKAKATAAKEKKAEMKKEDADEIELKHIFRDLVAEFGAAIPELLVRQQARYEFNELNSNLEQLNLKLDDYLVKRGLNTDQLGQELMAMALGKLQLEFVIEEITADAKLAVTPEDIKAEIAKIKDEKTRTQVEKLPAYQQQLTSHLLRQKVLAHLLAIS